MLFFRLVLFGFVCSVTICDRGGLRKQKLKKKIVIVGKKEKIELKKTSASLCFKYLFYFCNEIESDSNS